MTAGTLYPGKANSPPTFLTAGYTIGDGVLNVDDTSVFLAAPNIAVVKLSATDTTAVTYRYTAIGAGQLTGVTVLEGTDRDWPINTPVARDFTNYDWQAAIDQINLRATILYNPYSERANVYKGQLHCHSTNSDGAQSPTAVVNAYKTAGYNFISITDHDYLTPDPGVADILFITGTERVVKLGHIVFHNVPAVPAATTIQGVIDETFSEGGTSTLAHPDWPVTAEYNFWTDEDFFSIERFNFVEMYNYAGPQTGIDAKYDRLLTEGRRNYCTAVDDCHDVTSAGFNKGWVQVFADSLTVDDIMGALKTGNFYSSTGPSLTISMNGNTVTVTTPDSATIAWIGNTGKALKTTTTATSDTYTIVGDEGYVRVKITRDSDSKLAWTNPIFTGAPDRLTCRYVTKVSPQATKAVYVDSASTDVGNGESWATAFKNIEDALDSLPDIITQAVVIYVRAGASPYAEASHHVTKQCINGGYIQIRGEYYWAGRAAAASTPSNHHFQVASTTNMAVGDRIYMHNGYANYFLSTIKTIVSATELELNDNAPWGNISSADYYHIVRTQINGSSTYLVYFSGTELRFDGIWFNVTSGSISNAFVVLYGRLYLTDCILEGAGLTSVGIYVSSNSSAFIGGCYLSAPTYAVRVYNKSTLGRTGGAQYCNTLVGTAASGSGLLISGHSYVYSDYAIFQGGASAFGFAIGGVSFFHTTYATILTGTGYGYSSSEWSQLEYSTLTNNATVPIQIREGYWQSWTPTEVWGTATPASISRECRWTRIGKIVYWRYNAYSGDSNGTTSLTITLPVAPITATQYPGVFGYEIAGAGGATVYPLAGYITPSTSTITFWNFTAGTDGQTIRVVLNGFYEIA